MPKEVMNGLFALISALTLGFGCIVVGQTTPQTTTIHVIRDGKKIPLREAMVERRGRRVLVVGIREPLLEIVRGDDKVRLETSSDATVRILENKYLVGLTPNTETTITLTKDGDPVKAEGVDSFIVAVEDRDTNRHIVAESTFMSFKNVKDNYGKKFAQSFFVVQVDIRNEKLDKQFIVQNVSVIIDPNQCIKAKQIYQAFSQQDCLSIFDDHFIYPALQTGTRPDEVLIGGKADLNRSNQNVGFRILEFSASMGSILSGFPDVLGPDGVRGMNVLGTTVTAAAKKLFPDTSADKLENLRKALPAEDMIIKSKESKVINLFIPADRIFYAESWKSYIKTARDSDLYDYKLRVALDMMLLSTATGVLVDNDAPTVEVRSDDDVERQVEKFGLKNLLALSAGQSRRVIQIRRQLSAEARDNSQKVRDAAKEKIIRALESLKEAAGKPDAKITLAPSFTVFTKTESAEALFNRLEAAIRQASNVEEPENLAIATGEILRILEQAIKE